MRGATARRAGSKWLDDPTLPDMELTELPVTAEHAIGVAALPPTHRDPFDRLLVAQSTPDPMVLLTNDAVLARYGPVVRVV